MPIHPKVSGAAVGAALGVLIVAIIHSIPGVHLAAEADAAIPSFLSLLGAWLIPGPGPAAVENPYLSDEYKQSLAEYKQHLTGPTAPVE